jgi:hypothetical protein
VTFTAELQKEKPVLRFFWLLKASPIRGSNVNNKENFIEIIELMHYIKPPCEAFVEAYGL